MTDQSTADAARETAYREWMHTRGPTWSDPEIFQAAWAACARHEAARIAELEHQNQEYYRQVLAAESATEEEMRARHALQNRINDFVRDLENEREGYVRLREQLAAERLIARAKETELLDMVQAGRESLAAERAARERLEWILLRWRDDENYDGVALLIDLEPLLKHRTEEKE